MTKPALALAALVGLAALAVVLLPPEALPPAVELPDDPALADPKLGIWPRWRGPRSDGVSDVSAVPTAWDAASNVAWKTVVPAAGNSSPVVWGDRVFLTGATGGTRKPGRTIVHAFGRADGRSLWSAEVPVLRLPAKAPSRNNGWATPTLACNGRRLVAVFATGTMAGLTMDGRIAWTLDLGPIDHLWGLAASPAVDDARAYYAVDQGKESTQPSYLIAVDVATGKTAWRAPIAASEWRGYASPVIVPREGGAEISLWSGDRIAAYDAATGTPRGHAPTFHEVEPIATPMAAGDVLYLCQSDRASAWRLTKAEPIGPPAPLWSIDAEADARFARVAGSVAYDGRLYGVSETGEASCHDAATGNRRWSGKLGETAFYAAPVAAAGHVFFLARSGTCHVLKAGDRFELASVNRLGERADASPAVAEGRMYLRTRADEGTSTLWCIGK